MCPIAKGPHHGPAPIPEEGRWVKAYQISDISGLSHGIGWCAPQPVSYTHLMIMSGELQSGDAIPSMRALAKSIHVSVITVQKAYEDLQRDCFIETTVGRGSFVSAQNKEFYQEEQQRIAEEHLQAAAEIGRTSNISLEKLTELLALFYQEDD